jgi:uncharacterized protein
MSGRTLTLNQPAIAEEKLGFFRFGRVGERWLITNDAGEWQLLEDADWRRFLAGEIEEGDTLYAPLHDKGFLRSGIDLDGLAARVRRKKSFLGNGPHLHVVITTLRCNQGCRYCHASRTDMERVDTDMSLETARKVVDLAMKSTSPYVCFEFQGGEPTVNMPVIKFVTGYAREKNKQEGKILDLSLVSNMTWMTEENADWLVANDVLICTSLDGPEDLHNWNRTWTGKGSGNAYASVTKWMDYFNAAYVAKGRDPELWHVDALLTTTRRTLPRWKEIVDLYVSRGIRNLHLRPLNPFGFATGTWKRIGYTTEEFLEFYTNALDYIIELNLQGVEIAEGVASTILKKILTPDDPNFVDIRSPVGSGTGQLAYNYDGRIYPSDEGRMVSAMGDEIFAIGHVDSSTYQDLVGHPTVRSLAVSSLLDTLPMCSSCWNAPYCGARPLHNYMTSGDLFAQRPNTAKCKEHMYIAGLLFKKLAEDQDGRILKIFQRWTINRPRDAAEE